MEKFIPCAVITLVVLATVVGLLFGGVLFIAELVASLGADGMSLLAVVTFSFGGMIAILMVVRAVSDMHYNRQLQQLTVARQVRQINFVRADGYGLLPVDIDSLRSPAVLHGVMQQYLEHQISRTLPGAKVPNVYSPHLVYQNDVDIDGESVPDQLSDSEWKVASFGELLTKGYLGGGQFLLGYNLADGKPISADWRGLYSGGVAGQQGSGKTSTVRSLLCQSLLNNAEVAVIDPHAVFSNDSLSRSIEPLHPYLHAPIASDEGDIVQMLRHVGSVMDRRVGEAKANPEGEFSPFVLVVDEMMHLLENEDVADDLNKLVQRLVSQGRKLSVFMLTIAHVYAANLFQKGSSVRALLGTRFVHTLDATQARVLVSTEFARDADKLAPGQAILRANMLGTYRVGIPYCTVEDCASVAQKLSTQGEKKQPMLVSTTGSAELPANFPEGSQKLAGSEQEALGFRPRRVRELILQGKTQTEVIKEVWNVKGGPKYQAAAVEYNNLLRELLGGT